VAGGAQGGCRAWVAPNSSPLGVLIGADRVFIERCVTPGPPPLQEDADRLASNAAASTSSSSSTLKDWDFVSPQQRTLFSLFDSYADVFYAAKPYPGAPGWRPGQPDEAMDAVLLHVLNHCAKAADVIKKNNDRIKGLDAGEAADSCHCQCTAALTATVIPTYAQGIGEVCAPLGPLCEIHAAPLDPE
jgi:hypothetical protein